MNGTWSDSFSEPNATAGIASLTNVTVSDGDVKLSRIDVISEPSFETVTDWTYSETDSDFDGAQSAIWKTDGTYSYRFSSTHNIQSGKHSQILQSVDFTNLDTITFDANLSQQTEDKFEAQVLVDSTIVWSKEPPTTETEYLNESINVSSYTGTHNLTFRIKTLERTGNNYQTNYFDNIRANYYSSENLTSTPITPSSSVGWDKFHANDTLNATQGTNITYNILNATDNSTLCTVTSTQANAGYDFASNASDVSSIRLYADLTTSDTAYTPVLHDWNVSWIAPPVISNVTAANITDSSATITWDTNELSDSLVKYGTEPANYTLTPSSNATPVLKHSIALFNLSGNITYYYVVNSTDSHGNSKESAEYTFTTLPEGSGGGGNVPPIADAGENMMVYIGKEVQFNGSGSSDDEPIENCSFTWDFGDGNTSTEMSPTHNYSAEGDYIVNLTVTDNDGASSDDRLNVTVFNMTISASPTRIWVKGQGIDTAQITVNATRDNGIAVPDVPINFSTNLGILDSLTATTNATGLAKVTLTSGDTAGYARITATEKCSGESVTTVAEIKSRGKITLE